ncbi:MAG: prolipoprotein diacylglyceryl transferase [Anaerolineales bacterium]|nr:prolipoprotein diacylglyceryl transferase [Anaerolineales bacterium]
MIALFQNLFAPPRHIILLVLAVWLGATLAERRAERFGVSKDDLNNFVFYGLFAFVGGGRLAYVLQHLSIFAKSPLSAISVNLDLFDTFGAFAAFAIFLVAYTQKKSIPLWDALDALTPLFALTAVGLGLSNFASGAAFGAPTSAAWGVEQWNAVRHPTQLYDALAALLIFILIWRFKANLPAGVSFLTFVALTSLSQIFLQTYRARPPLFGAWNQSQVFAWLILLVCFFFLESRLSSQTKKN